MLPSELVKNFHYKYLQQQKNTNICILLDNVCILQNVSVKTVMNTVKVLNLKDGLSAITISYDILIKSDICHKSIFY